MLTTFGMSLVDSNDGTHDDDYGIDDDVLFYLVLFVLLSRYSILLMVLNYFLPMITLFATYARIGWELWGSQTIGEVVPMQAERVRSKRKVSEVK